MPLMSSHGASAALAASLSALLFAALQMFKSSIVESRPMTVLGGFASSWLFILLLTTVSNVEMSLFGSSFQCKIFPEVAFCFLIAVILAAQVHGVCATTCVPFSLMALYYLTTISAKTYPGNSAGESREKATRHGKKRNAEKSS